MVRDEALTQLKNGSNLNHTIFTKTWDCFCSISSFPFMQMILSQLKLEESGHSSRWIWNRFFTGRQYILIISQWFCFFSRYKISANLLFWIWYFRPPSDTITKGYIYIYIYIYIYMQSVSENNWWGLFT